MTEHPRRVWITALVLGWLLDFLFWKQAPGLNFALYVVSCLVGGLLLLRMDGRRMAPRNAVLVGLIIMLAAVTFIRSEPLTVFLGALLALFLMAMFASTFVGGRWVEYNFADYVLGVVRLTWSALTRPFAFRSQVQKMRPANRGAGLWGLLRGLLLALPVVVFFGALLASADLVFGRQLDAFIQFLSLERLPEYVFRLVYIFCAAFALLGVFLHAANRSDDQQLTAQNRPEGLRFLGFTESAVVLGSVAVLFVAFVAVQFRYFFGGEINIGTEGFTYSEYARRGYGELMAVAVCSLLLILGLGFITRRDRAGQARAFSGMSVLVVALVGVMLVSAYMRLGLYEAAYGFTRLRTYVHVSLVWVGVLLAAVVVLEVLRRERIAATAVLMVCIGFALTLGAINVDGLIVKNNVDRAALGSELDVPYLVTLSDDSVPALAALFQDPAYSDAMQEVVGAVLACRLQVRSGPAPTDWRSWTLSRFRAQGVLDAIRPALQVYRDTTERDVPGILTPGGKSYECLPNGN